MSDKNSKDKYANENSNIENTNNTDELSKKNINEDSLIQDTEENQTSENLISETGQEEKQEEQEEHEEEKSTEEKLNDEIIKLRDEKLRLLAEMENLRKRSDKDRVDSIRYGSINLARDILSPDDNLSRALEAIPQEKEKSETINNLIEGLRMVQKEFSTILEKYGVKKIDALNEKFDHNYHQAMVEIENNDVEPGTVIEEMQSGYTMHDRLLRPSMVGVSKKSTPINDNEKD
tara:strand:+ start:307 stop:1005 length:699 start_codon:yes stop_codon:yes gene_type:complete